MSPKVYMCYLIYAKYGNFDRLVNKWNYELYKNTIKLEAITRKMKETRKYKSNNWDNFDIEQLFNFIKQMLQE